MNTITTTRTMLKLAIATALIGLTCVHISPAAAQSPSCLNGLWVADDGGTVNLNWTGAALTGNGTGGRGHESLRNQFNLQGGGGRFGGTCSNQEGVVRGSGGASIDVLPGASQIRLGWNGQWSGGGTSGHTNGATVFSRRNAGRC